jgi:hypothetical protein
LWGDEKGQAINSLCHIQYDENRCMMSEKINDKLKSYYEGYVLTPPKNSDYHMLSGVCLVYLQFVISVAKLRCSPITRPISVCRRTTRLRYWNHEWKTHKDIHQITRNSRHSQAIQNTMDNSGTTHLTNSCEMHHSQTGDA